MVALKVRFFDAATERDELLHESRLLYGLTPHPGLPLLRDDFFYEDDAYFAVMDWVEGRDLQHVLQSDGSPGLDVPVALDALREVADALEHLHAHQPPVVHRDVKPANIVVTSDGRAVLVDFGISTRGADAASGFTRGFAAPELGSTTAEVTPAADIFSLAATAFTLLTGAPPRALSTAPPLKGSWLRRRRAMRVLRQALAYDPTRRPTSALAFVQRLHRVLDPRTAPRRSRRLRWVAAGTVVAAGTASAAIAVALPRGLAQSKLTLAASQRSVSVDDPVVLSGRLQIPGRKGPWSLEIGSLDAGSAASDSQRVSTSADGSFHYTVHPASSGTVVYEAAWRGDRTSRPANAATPAISVAGRRSTLALRQVGTITSYGQKATLEIVKNPARAGDPVSLTRGGRVVASGRLDTRGVLHVVTAVPSKSSYVVSFAATPREAAAQSRALVVRAVHRVSFRLTGYRSKSGQELLFGPNDPLKVALTITPRVSSGCVYDRIEQFVDNAWRPEFVGNCAPARNLGGFTFGNGARIGMRHRMRLEYEQAKDDVDVSSWTYFRVP
jgi:hypothetical protein